VQAKIDARRTPGAGEDVALVDKKHARIDRQEGIAARQFIAFGPVRGRTATRTVSIMPLSPPGVRPHHGLVTTPRFFRVIAHSTGEKPRIDRRLHSQAGQVQPEGPSTGPATLLLIDPSEPQQLTALFNRRWARLLARLLASSLDRQLAQGRSPESNRLLATRAQVLVSPAERYALAQSCANLLVQARRPSVMRNPRAPLNRECIIACEPEIREMIDALLAPLATPARGAAMVSRLLSDGSGPLYNRHHRADLAIAVAEAVAGLDPSVSLVPLVTITGFSPDSITAGSTSHRNELGEQLS
jgi:hypothetical protein